MAIGRGLKKVRGIYELAKIKTVAKRHMRQSRSFRKGKRALFAQAGARRGLKDTQLYSKAFKQQVKGSKPYREFITGYKKANPKWHNRRLAATGLAIAGAGFTGTTEYKRRTQVSTIYYK